MIRRNVDLEVRLIDDLLDVSRAVSGKLRLSVDPVRIHELLRFVQETCASDLTQKKISLKLNLDAKSDHVNADGTRMQQVFWNLLKNAIKFSGEGQTIEISTSNAAPGSITICVKDYGIGISPDVLPRIFAAFEQGSSTTTQRFGGLGLGLAIAKAVTELHGGTVHAESGGPGQGASFFVRLPLTEPKTASVPSPTIAQRPLTEKTVRVLVVEDHQDTANVLAMLLKLAGYQVTTAGTAHAALQAIAAARFDIVVSDVGLPDSTGYDLMREIREKYNLPGIAMTGYGMEEDFARSREAGFVAHVVKPINMEQLERVIRSVTGAAPSG
jgi:CheY-like chemotaxis protein